jgi:hypothetical protein
MPRFSSHLPCLLLRPCSSSIDGEVVNRAATQHRRHTHDARVNSKCTAS